MSSFRLFETELIVVDDGSTDDTNEIVTKLLCSIPRSQLITCSTNLGKGEALRRGVAESSGDVVLFMDADLSTSLAGTKKFISNLAKFDIVIGSRTVRGSITNNSAIYRMLMGRCYNRLRKLLFLRAVQDSQCGFKVFRGDIARKLFGISTCKRFSIDVEILRLAEVLSFSILELPVVWTAGSKSSVRPVRDSLFMIIELVVLRLKLSRRRVSALAAKWDKREASKSQSLDT